MMVARQYLISGIVQGVGFRYFVVRVARQRSIVGYVRNLPDGRVEVVAEGDQMEMGAFKKELEQGPPFGRVTEIREIERLPTGQFTCFTVEF